MTTPTTPTDLDALRALAHQTSVNHPLANRLSSLIEQAETQVPGWRSPSTGRRTPFRCRICGDDRDTTIRGRCDDCDA